MDSAIAPTHFPLVSVHASIDILILFLFSYPEPISRMKMTQRNGASERHQSTETKNQNFSYLIATSILFFSFVALFRFPFVIVLFTFFCYWLFFSFFFIPFWGKFKGSNDVLRGKLPRTFWKLQVHLRSLVWKSLCSKWKVGKFFELFMRISNELQFLNNPQPLDKKRDKQGTKETQIESNLEVKWHLLDTWQRGEDQDRPHSTRSHRADFLIFPTFCLWVDADRVFDAFFQALQHCSRHFLSTEQPRQTVDLEL